MKVLEAGDWSLILPDEWAAQRDEGRVFIGDRDGVGSLEITPLHKPAGVFKAADIAAIADPAQTWSATRCGNFHGRAAAFEERGEALREWYLMAGELLLFVTYSCAVAHRGLDDAAVDEMLDTLRYAKEDRGGQAGRKAGKERGGGRD